MRYVSLTLAGSTSLKPPSGEAEAWLCGMADLPFVARLQAVPPVVQVGVLAHGSLSRLADLGRLQRRGSVRRYWGTGMAALAGEVAAAAGTDEQLLRLQRDVVVPLEVDLLDRDEANLTRDEVVGRLRSALRSWPRRPDRQRGI